MGVASDCQCELLAEAPEASADGSVRKGQEDQFLVGQRRLRCTKFVVGRLSVFGTKRFWHLRMTELLATRINEDQQRCRILNASAKTAKKKENCRPLTSAGYTMTNRN